MSETFEDKLTDEELEEWNEAIEESKAEKERKEREAKREETKYGGQITHD